MARVDRGTTGSKTEDGNIFAYVVGFLRRNWKFLGLLTVVLLAGAVALILLLPTQYQKQVSLKPELAPSELLARTEPASLPGLGQDALVASAVTSLQSGAQSGTFGEVGVSAVGDPPTAGVRQRINATLRSSNEDALEEATPGVVSFLEVELERRYEGEVGDALERELGQAERDVQTKSGALARVERQAGQNSVGESIVLASLAEAETEQEDLEQVVEDIPQAAAEAISVEVVSESDVTQTRALTGLVLLAVAVSLATAVALALAREALARRK